MLTTIDDSCPIAEHARRVAESLRELTDVIVEPIERGKQEMERYQEQAARLNDADLAHIQHDHSFWGGVRPGESAFWNLRYLIQKPVVITAHDTRPLPELLRDEKSPGLLMRAKDALLLRGSYSETVDTAPFVTGRCIVLKESDRSALVSRGAKPEYVHLIPPGDSDAGWREAARQTFEVYQEAIADVVRLAHHL